MKKLFALIAVLVMLLTTALAEAADPLAAADAFLQQMEALKLEMQIVDLEIQLSTMKGDSAALAVAQSKKTALQDDMTRLSAQALQSLNNGQAALQAQADDIRAQIASLEAALGENEAQQKLLAERYEECLLTSALTASAKGFISEVAVYVMLDDSGAISALYVDASKETPFMGARCGEDEAFLSQFIGKTIPLTAGVDVDVLSGATFTSNAVINAINGLAADDAASAPSAHEVRTGTAFGFASEVTVTLTIENGVITGIEANVSGETPGMGSRCGTDAAFLDQFIGKKATPDPGEGIDVLAGATLTSNAVIEAANAAIGVAQAVVDLPASEYTASAKGLLSEVWVTISVDESGRITAITVDASGETQVIARPCTEEPFLSQFIGRGGPFTDVDIVSGATFTSNAVINAVNSLYEEGVIK